MAVRFFTDGAQALLNAFDARILQSAPEGKITTWQKSEDGKYYTHKSAEWHSLAWFRPEVYSDKLVFNIIKPKGRNVSIVTYGYYHGHLIETFLNHFEDNFSIGSATARPTDRDRVR